MLQPVELQSILNMACAHSKPREREGRECGSWSASVCLSRWRKITATLQICSAIQQPTRNRRSCLCWHLLLCALGLASVFLLFFYFFSLPRFAVLSWGNIKSCRLSRFACVCIVLLVDCKLSFFSSPRHSKRVAVGVRLGVAG